MKSSILLITIVLFHLSCNRGIRPSTGPILNMEKGSGASMLLGRASVSALQKSPYKDWYDAGFNNYRADNLITQSIRPLLANKKIEIFLGTWCGDSKREVPNMIRILTDAGYDTSLVTLICVDNELANYKQSPQHEEVGKNIHHVPTFIIYDEKQEIGRIVERPITSLEKDLSAILHQQSYEHNYQAIEYWLKKVKGINKEMTPATIEAVAAALKGKTKHQGEFNAYGYMLLGQKKYVQAINVFNLNVLLYPNNTSLWDSLAEGYALSGNKKAAIQAYEKILQLEPSNQGAKKAIEQLKL